MACPRFDSQWMCRTQAAVDREWQYGAPAEEMAELDSWRVLETCEEDDEVAEIFVFGSSDESSGAVVAAAFGALPAQLKARSQRNPQVAMLQKAFASKVCLIESRTFPPRTSASFFSVQTHCRRDKSEQGVYGECSERSKKP